ncbi:MAG: type II secretion system F family protein [Kiritimatiellae bacterium]|nr:type II secretion system F family protein [Kiritimatiellia bacterium]MDD5521282.1 type II secretion system F family protein [Kiritimatiellia bacterium]
MAIFLYTARNKKGEKVEGTIEANDKRSALLVIERSGHIPVSVKERGAAAAVPEKVEHFSWHGRTVKMRGRDVLIFTTELSDLLASGMTLGNALNALANRKTGKPSDKIIVGLRDEIVQGTNLSDAMAKHPATFSKLYVSMIKAGEASGALHEVLRRLVDHYERMQEVKEKVTMALVYPAIVISLGICTLIFTMVVVVPKFQMIFQQIGQTLPLPTRILIGISRGTMRYGWIVLIGLIFAGFSVAKALKTDRGRFWWDGVVLKMPLVKGIVASAIFSNFARTLSTLLTNGVPVLQALGIVEQTVGNAVIGAEIHNAKERVTDGTTISGPLAASKVFPNLMTDMLAIGEQTGDMPSSLSHIATRYERELNRNVKIFTTALEPILIVVLAALVGFVVMSILLAVISMSDGLNA